jgi:hypothetical protein
MVEEPIKEAARTQGYAIKLKAKAWLKYIDNKVEEMRDGGANFYDYATTWYLIFAYINWLACFYFANGHNIKSHHIDELFNKELGWEEGIGKVLWASSRNPINHVAQDNPFYSYTNLDGHPAYFQHDMFYPWQDPQPPYYKFSHPTETDAIIISIMYDGLRPELIKLSKVVSTRVKNISSEKELQQIVKVNEQIPH